ncbi:MAG: hypothetical protein RL367_1867, partial [Pseudomonadota bacterium]
MQNFDNRTGQDGFDDLFQSAFQLSGTLTAARDRLVRDVGLTSALWQVLDTVAGSDALLGVSEIARRIGLT